jgi:hypothetical protein
MKRLHVVSLGVATLVTSIIGITFAADGRFTVTSPNGIAFAEFKGYDRWELIAPSQPANSMKVILGNPIMMKAYSDGFPGNGQAIPDGAAMAKIDWSLQANPHLPGAKMPDTLKKVQFMVKDAKRFPDTDGWGYAHFDYDAASGTFTASGNSPTFAKAACHQCHTQIKANDFVFTTYARR